MGVYDQARGAYRTNSGVGACNGVADILGVLPNGRFFAIEVKGKGDKLSDEQVEFISNIIKNGGLAFVAHSLQDAKDKMPC